jgi:hypothetical protein
LISYYDNTNKDLKVAHCDDAACSNASIYTLDNNDIVGRYNSITIGVDGIGLVGYTDYDNEDLVVAHCDDLLCKP